MDAKDLFISLYDNAGFQLNQVFKDIPADGWDTKSNPHAMSARETAAHLTEAYVACNKMLRGEEHDWGTHSMETSNPEQLLADMSAEREVAKSAALAAEDTHVFKEVLAYTASHDYYHVGQMCTLRAHLDPQWNSYSIYG